MANFKDISDLIGGKEDGKMSDQMMNIPSEVKEKAISLLDEARDMLNQQGIDGGQFLISHLGGEDTAVREASGIGANKKALLIMALKRKRGIE